MVKYSLQGSDQHACLFIYCRVMVKSFGKLMESSREMVGVDLF